VAPTPHEALLGENRKLLGKAWLSKAINELGRRMYVSFDFAGANVLVTGGTSGSATASPRLSRRPVPP